MAISGGDGSIILTTSVDTGGIRKGSSNIKSLLNNIGNFAKQTGVKIQAAFSSMKEQRAAIQSLNQAIKDQEYVINSLNKQYFQLVAAGQLESTEAQELKERIKQLNTELNEMNAALASVSGNKQRKNIDAVGKGFQNLGKRLMNIAKSALIFSVIYRALRAMVDIIKNVAMGNEEFRQSVEQLQAALWVAFTPILNIIVPALKTMVDWLTRAAIAVGKFFAAISGKSYASMIQNAKGLKQQSDNYKKLGKSAKDAKKQLAGFDEIQILSSDSSSDAGDASANIFKNFGAENEVNAMLSAIMGVVGGAMVALGVLLLFYGQIGWGIGFIIAGAATMGVNIANIANSDLGIAEKFSSIMAIVGGFILAIGIVLLLKVPSAQPLALGMIIAGAGVLAVGVAQMAANKVGGDIEKMLHGIIAIASGFLLAIGLIMLFSGKITPLSIGLTITGAVGLASEVSLYPDAVIESLRGWLGAILALLSTALLVIGIIMCATSHITPLSIGLIIAGAVGLASVAAVNWDFIVQQMQGTFGKIMAIVSAGLIVIGLLIIFASGGTALGLGLGLIIAGAAGLATVVAFNWNFIIDKVKEVWQNIKNYWNENIAPIFTAEWWKNLGEKVMNGLIAGFEAGINGIIGMFEKMINWIVDGLNKISFDVPDWVPGIGGKTFGFNISKVKFNRVDIPPLAQGTVVPPNRKFLAMLGDNTKEHEIVSPVSTMKQAFTEAMIEMGGNFGGGNTEVVLEIDGREFGRAVVEQGNRENRRIGTRLVIA